MDRHDTPASELSNTGSRRPGVPGRVDQVRTRHPAARPGRLAEASSTPTAESANASPAQGAAPVLRTPATEVLRELLGPMRWLGAPKGSDLSEALGGMPGDAGWMLALPGDGGMLCITVSRRLGAIKDETRVVLFQEVRGYGGFTWCLSADTPQSLDRIRAEVQTLLNNGAQVMRTGRP